jgi:hypothetical protein
MPHPVYYMNWQNVFNKLLHFHFFNSFSNFILKNIFFPTYFQSKSVFNNFFQFLKLLYTGNGNLFTAALRRVRILSVSSSNTPRTALVDYFLAANPNSIKKHTDISFLLLHNNPQSVATPQMPFPPDYPRFP